MELDVQFPGGPMAPTVARGMVGKLRSRIPRELVDDLRLLVSELVTNSVLHGGSGQEGTIHLHVETSPSKVRVEVQDEGPGFRRRKHHGPLAEKVSGWGLLLVDSLSDRWGVRRSEGTVWLEIDRGKAK